MLGRLPAFRRAAGDERSHDRLVGLVCATLIAAGATALRSVLDPVLPPGFPYLTYFPAVILSAFVFGTATGLYAGLLCGLAAWYWFIPPLESFALTWPSGVALAFYVLVIGIDIALIHLAIKAYAAEARVRQQLGDLLAQQNLLAAEVDHRMRNMFTILSGLVTMSQRHASSPVELGDSLRSRISAMGRSHSVLRGAINGEAATLVETVKAAVAPFETSANRFAISGPPLTPSGPAMLSISLILNELATNAVKYGALAAESGKVIVQWRTDGPAIVLVWTEQGGVASATIPGLGSSCPDPQGGGFGSHLVATLAQGLGGAASFDHLPGGMQVTITMAITMVARDG